LAALGANNKKKWPKAWEDQKWTGLSKSGQKHTKKEIACEGERITSKMGIGSGANWRCIQVATIFINKRVGLTSQLSAYKSPPYLLI
jgi:hypothetical protein